MAKPVDKKTMDKGKPKASKPADVYHIMRDLQPGERFNEPPPSFAGHFRVSRGAVCRALRRYGILNEGVFRIYSSKENADKNRLWRQVDLSKCTISYRARDRRILVDLAMRYRLRVPKAQFESWVDSIRAHRLFALAKASQEPTKVIDTVLVSAINAPAANPDHVGVPLAAMAIPATVDVHGQESVRPEPTGDRKTRIPVPVTIVASDNKPKTPIQPKQTILPKMEPGAKVVRPSTEAPKTVTLMLQPKPAEKEQQQQRLTKSVSTPMTVEVFAKEHEPTTGKTRVVPVGSPVTIQVPPPAVQPPQYPASSPVSFQGSPVEPPPKEVVQAPPPPPPPIVKEPVAPIATPPPVNKPPPKKEKIEEQDEKSEDSGVSTETTEAQNMKPLRLKLPSPMGAAPSIFRLIMGAIGKDVMRMALPATIMEPLSTLQVLCEEIENAELIDRALTKTAPVWRMIYVTAFAMSRYGSTAKRANRKPFNPLLGETYEYVHPTNGWRFVAEQVSHHPAVTACFSEGNGWRLWQDCEVAASLSTSAVKATPHGLVNLRFEKLGETYVWNKVVSQVSGLFSGHYVIDHIGDMNITCKETGLKCKMNFKKMSGTHRGEVEGEVINDRGKSLRRIFGSWTDSFFADSSKDGDPIRVWKIAEMPPEHERYYGFTRFAMGLNEMRPDVHGVLPKTDTRYRPDQRALENGKPDEAEKLKRELEEKQRQRRKVQETAKTTYTPAWFQSTGNSDPANGPRWEFTGKYWQAKNNGFKDFDLIDLW